MSNYVIQVAPEYGERIATYAETNGLTKKAATEQLLDAAIYANENPEPLSPPRPDAAAPETAAEYERALEEAIEAKLVAEERASRLEADLELARETMEAERTARAQPAASVIQPAGDGGPGPCRCDGPAGRGNWHSPKCSSYDPAVPAP